MNPRIRLCLSIATATIAGLIVLPVLAQPMLREDVVDVPTISKGLCVSNVFQTNMVLQRDKPIHVWGWAEPGEQVTVNFVGEQASAKAGKDRAWKVTLPAVPAHSTPEQMTVKGKSKTLVLDNILVGDVWVLGNTINRAGRRIDKAPDPCLLSRNYHGLKSI